MRALARTSTNNLHWIGNAQLVHGTAERCIPTPFDTRALWSVASLESSDGACMHARTLAQFGSSYTAYWEAHTAPNAKCTRTLFAWSFRNTEQSGSNGMQIANLFCARDMHCLHMLCSCTASTVTCTETHACRCWARSLNDYTPYYAHTDFMCYCFRLFTHVLSSERLRLPHYRTAFAKRKTEFTHLRESLDPPSLQF